MLLNDFACHLSLPVAPARMVSTTMAPTVPSPLCDACRYDSPYGLLHHGSPLRSASAVLKSCPSEGSGTQASGEIHRLRKARTQEHAFQRNQEDLTYWPRTEGNLHRCYVGAALQPGEQSQRRQIFECASASLQRLTYAACHLCNVNATVNDRFAISFFCIGI